MANAGQAASGPGREHDGGPRPTREMTGAARVLRGGVVWAPLWFLVYLTFHAWEHSALRGGRDALLTRLASSASTVAEVAFVLVPLAVYLARRDLRPVPALSARFQQLERGAGFGALLLLFAHLGYAWLPRLGREGAVSAAYSAMLDQTGTLPQIALQLGFISAAVVHLTLALVSVFCSLGSPAEPPAAMPAVSQVALRRAVIVACLVGGGVWLALLNVLAAYGAGAPLL